MLFEMLSGEPPFVGSRILGTHTHQQQEPWTVDRTHRCTADGHGRPGDALQDDAQRA